MRLNLARTACAVALATFALTACKVSVKTGGSEEPAPPPPPPPAAKPAPAPKPKPKLTKMKFKTNEKGEVQLPGPVLFETGKAVLLPESDAVLDIVDQYLKAKPEITKLRIEGHTDTDGPENDNINLSKARAMSVSQWLTAKGNDCKRLVPVGFGETRLLVKVEKNDEDKATNRRVVFINAEIKGKPIAGLPVDGGGQIAGDPCQ